MNIETRELQPQTLLTVRGTTESDTKSISAKIHEMYDEIDVVIKDNNLSIVAPCLTIFHDYDEQTADFEAGTPVNADGKDIKLSGNVNLLKMPGGKTLVASYYGPYEGLGDAYNALFAYAKNNNIKWSGSPWEIYVTNPQNEPDSGKWLTEVCVKLA